MTWTTQTVANSAWNDEAAADAYVSADYWEDDYTADIYWSTAASGSGEWVTL